MSRWRTFNRISRTPWLVLRALFLHAVLALCVRGGITNEGPLTVFRTGTNESLFTFSLPFDIPSTNAAPRLEFDFGFATDEPAASGTFFDSFSVTLQKTNESATALLLTADRSGVQWAPSNPGGLTLTPTDVGNALIAFPDLNPTMTLRYAYAVSYLLPPMLTAGLATLFFDFFDNLNQFASLAFVRNVRINAILSPPPPALFLQSSASFAGPFADESGVAIDPTNKVMTLSQFGQMRFFRLRTDVTSRINQMHIEGEQMVFQYSFQPQVLALQSARRVEATYADETNIVLDVPGQTISLARPLENRFYRLRSDAPSVIISEQVVGNQLVLRYDFAHVLLQSSAAVNGPYADESGVIVESANRRLKIPRLGQARFYRIRSDRATRITSITIRSGQLVFHYE